MDNDGRNVSQTIYPIETIPSGNDLYLGCNHSRESGYETFGVNDTWELVQFSRSAGLFKSKSECMDAVYRYLDNLNAGCDGAYGKKHCNFKFDDVFVKIVKIGFIVGMQITGD